ncbi:hypothetical protein J6590_022842 [Homalodisca vitripennis]|nr:hypothetical protein J6590_022842 [Homalodisca vitripennis]
MSNGVALIYRRGVTSWRRCQSTFNHDCCLPVSEAVIELWCGIDLPERMRLSLSYGVALIYRRGVTSWRRCQSTFNHDCCLPVSGLSLSYGVVIYRRGELAGEDVKVPSIMTAACL